MNTLFEHTSDCHHRLCKFYFNSFGLKLPYRFFFQRAAYSASENAVQRSYKKLCIATYSQHSIKLCCITGVALESCDAARTVD